MGSVAKFIYLGRELEEEEDVELDVNIRLGRAAGVFRAILASHQHMAIKVL